MNIIRDFLKPYKGLPNEIYILFICRMINSIGAFVYPLITLILTKKVGLPKSSAGLYITLLSASTVPSLMIGGKLVDSIGRKRLMVIFQGLGAITIICCAFLEPTIKLVYMLIISTNFFMTASPAYDALLADLTVPENRKISYSLLYMGNNLGLALGPFIGGMLFNNHLPLVFIFDGVTTIISVILIGIYIKETIHSKENGIENNDRKFEKAETGSVFSILIRRPILIYFALILFIYNFAYSQWSFLLPIQLTNKFSELGSKYYGALASFNGLIVIVCTPIIQRYTNKIKDMIVIVLGGIFYALAYFIYSFVPYLLLFYIGAFIMTLGEIMVVTNASSFVADRTPASHRGRVSSILPIIFGAGYSIGPLVMGHFTMIYSLNIAWITIAILVFVGAIIMYILSKHERKFIKIKS